MKHRIRMPTSRKTDNKTQKEEKRKENYYVTF